MYSNASYLVLDDSDDDGDGILDDEEDNNWDECKNREDNGDRGDGLDDEVDKSVNHIICGITISFFNIYPKYYFFLYSFEFENQYIYCN